MPIYTLKCLKCGKEKDIVCIVKERNNMRCRCGGRMRVKITKPNFINRLKLKPKVQEWIKKKGL